MRGTQHSICCERCFFLGKHTYVYGTLLQTRSFRWNQMDTVAGIIKGNGVIKVDLEVHRCEKGPLVIIMT